MPALTAAITYLTLTGTPGPELLGATGHGAETVVAKSVSDTIRPIIAEGDYLNRDYELFDQLVPHVTDTGLPGLVRATSDTLRPVITDLYVSLVKTGDVPLAVSDTVKPVLHELTHYNSSIGVADSLVPVVTDTGTSAAATSVAVTLDSLVPVLTDAASVATYTPGTDVAVSDSLVPVLTDIMGVGQFILVRDLVTDDDLVPYIVESVVVGAFNDIDSITIKLSPIGSIRITET